MINPEYSEEQVNIKEILTNQGSVVLHKMLSEEGLKKLEENVFSLHFARDYKPHLHNFEQASPSETIINLMNELADFLGGEIKEILVRRYSRGSYYLRHDKQSELHHFVLFLAEWDPNYRGEFTYVPEGKAADFFYPENNTLAVVNCKDKQRFVKRINHYAGDNHFTAIEAFVKI